MKKGFTLIEVVIYSGILALFFAAVLVFVSNVLGSIDAVTERNEVVQNHEFIERKLEWVLQNVSQVQIPALNATASELRVVLNDGSNMKFLLSSDNLTLTEGAGLATRLNSLRTKVNDFTASNTSSSPTQIFVSLGVTSIAYPTAAVTSTFFYVLPK